MTKDLFDLFSQRIQKQYIIIDGLDECDIVERKSVLSFFNSVVEKLDAKDPGKMRVLFVSQDENDIKNALLTATVITLETKDNESDIRSFVRNLTIEIQPTYDLDDHQVEYVIDSTCARAQGTVSPIRSWKYLTQATGMFLFAKLVMSNLCAQPTRQNFQDEIRPNRFPQGLGQA